MAMPLGDEVRQERGQAVDDAPEVDVEHPVPLGQRELPEGPHGGGDHARVVAHDVDPAQLLQRLVSQLLQLFGLPHVGDDADGLDSLAA